MSDQLKKNSPSRWALWLPPLLSIGSYYLLVFLGWSQESSITAAVTLLCALWWTTEALPVPVTSLIPLALLPLLGVLSPTEVAQAYGNPIILLLMGGFMLSVALERTQTHQQIALRILHFIGIGSEKRIVIAFMCVAAVLSMWISNTATTLMLLPIAIAVLQHDENEHFVRALLLAVCYGASVGGIGTPIGTPPNLIFLQVYRETTGVEVSFLQWMQWAVPVVLVFLPLIGLWLTWHIQASSGLAARKSLPPRSAWTVAQKRVLWVFAATALAWITRKEPFGGWSGLLGLQAANDASVVLLAVVAMFLVPSGARDVDGDVNSDVNSNVNSKKNRLITWTDCEKIPWGILLLFAGGLCIAKAFVVSGLAIKIGEAFSTFASLPILLMIALLCLVVTFLTEVTSNTATTSLMMPILAATASVISVEPALLMVPAAMSASCAFMLPVATAPNAIIYGSGRVPIQTMMQRGVVLNLLGVLVISLICFMKFQ
jgi:sodium-dependent dicarboxylate transporter 2/3/5